MYRSLAAALALSAAAIAPTVAYADDEPAGDFTVSGSVTLATQYRLRGISQSDNRGAVQGGITVSHASGVYAGTWASNLAGYGSFGGSNMELDLVGGYSTAVGPVTLDGGVIYYVYPGTSGTDYFELYGSVAGKLGPVNAKLGTYWAPSQDHIGGHNIWVYTDWAFPIEGTPVTLKAHGGYSDGDSGYTKGEGIWDYSVGVDLAWKNLTLNVSYVGTDLDTARANALWTGGARSGHDITKGNVVATLTAAF